MECLFENISFGPMIIKQLHPLTDMIFDVHLMIEDPDRYIEKFGIKERIF